MAKRVLLILLLVGCGESEVRSRGPEPLNERSLRAYGRTVHPHLRAQCLTCHGSSLAHPDADASYRATRPFVRFDHIPLSKLVARTMDDHCGGACRTDGREMIRVLEEWWEQGERDEEPVTSVRVPLAELEVPPGPGRWILEWKLDDAGFPQTRLELEAARMVDGRVLLFKPRLFSGAFPLRIQKLRLGPGEIVSDRTVRPQSSPVLSAAVREADSGKVSGVFESLGQTPFPKCRDLAGFRSEVMPFYRGQCLSCHGTPGDLAHSRFPLTGSEETLCGQSLQRLDLGSAEDSPLLAWPAREMDGHPAADVTALRAWAAREK